MLHIEYVRSADMAGKLQSIRIWINLLYNLRWANLLGSKFVILMSWDTIFCQHRPHKIPHLEFHMSSFHVGNLLILSCGGLQMFMSLLMNVL